MNGDATGAGPEDRDRGFTVIELLIVVVLLGIVLGIGAEGFRSFARGKSVHRAAEAVAAEVELARLYALQRREPVEMVFDEPGRSYAIRVASSGDTLRTRSFRGGDLPLTVLDVGSGDRLEFSPRGLLAGGSTVSIAVENLSEAQRVDVSLMGMTRVVAP